MSQEKKVKRRQGTASVNKPRLHFLRDLRYLLERTGLPGYINDLTKLAETREAFLTLDILLFIKLNIPTSKAGNLRLMAQLTRRLA